MPSRVIRGEINASESLSRVSIGADLTFRALLVAVDDYGRADARPTMLKAELFPARESVTPEQVYGWVQELADEGCALLYRSGGREYLQLTGWEKHRSNSKRSGRSRFPEPPEISADAPGIQDPLGIRPSDVLRLASDECRVSSVVESEKAAEAAAPTTGERVESPSDPEPLQPPEAVEFAEAFRAGLSAAHLGFKEPTAAAFAKWANEARLMFQRDQRPPEEMLALADWLFNSPSAEAQFWRPNVLGVPKFREKYDQLQAQRRRSLHVVAESGPLERASRELAERIRGRSA